MSTLRNELKKLMLDFGIRFLKADVDRINGKENPDIGKSYSDICEEELNKFFEEQSK